MQTLQQPKSLERMKSDTWKWELRKFFDMWSSILEILVFLHSYNFPFQVWSPSAHSNSSHSKKGWTFSQESRSKKNIMNPSCSWSQNTLLEWPANYWTNMKSNNPIFQQKNGMSQIQKSLQKPWKLCWKCIRASWILENI